MTEPIQAEELAGEPGDSLEQREAETVMIRLLSERLGVELRTKRIILPAGGWLQLDGHSSAPSVACEAWAHQGEAKSAQKDKVTKDILKLMFVRTLLGDDTQLICCSVTKQQPSSCEAVVGEPRQCSRWG